MYDLDGKPVIRLIHQLRPNCFTHVMAAEWDPLQASLIKQDCFHKIDGFNPLIPGIEDVDLARRMSLHIDFSGTNDLVSRVDMSIDGSTTNQEKARLAGRQVRELKLNEQGDFSWIKESAENVFWRGSASLQSAFQPVIHSPG